MSDHKGKVFLNVDLDIESDADLSILANAFEPGAYSLERHTCPPSSSRLRSATAERGLTRSTLPS